MCFQRFISPYQALALLALSWVSLYVFSRIYKPISGPGIAGFKLGVLFYFWKPKKNGNRPFCLFSCSPSITAMLKHSNDVQVRCTCMCFQGFISPYKALALLALSWVYLCASLQECFCLHKALTPTYQTLKQCRLKVWCTFVSTF